MGDRVKRINLVYAGIVAALVGGCASNNSPSFNHLSGDSVVCSKDCDTKFARAEYWINKHSKLKIQTVTRNTIETYSPYKGKQYGFRVSKEPIGGGKYIIHTEVIPYLEVGEAISSEDTMKILNHYIRTGEDLADGIGGGLFSSIR